jgi:hypothetical protein
MEIIYIITISIFNTILTVGSIVYFHCRLNKMDLKIEQMDLKIEQMDLRIEHEIKNQKHTQGLLKEFNKTKPTIFYD